VKKHVFLSFNVEYGTNGRKNTVTLLDGETSRTWEASAA
jgi:hypothetical protein